MLCNLWSRHVQRFHHETMTLIFSISIPMVVISTTLDLSECNSSSIEADSLFHFSVPLRLLPSTMEDTRASLFRAEYDSVITDDAGSAPLHHNVHKGSFQCSWMPLGATTTSACASKSDSTGTHWLGPSSFSLHYWAVVAIRMVISHPQTSFHRKLKQTINDAHITKLTHQLTMTVMGRLWFCWHFMV